MIDKHFLLQMFNSLPWFLYVFQTKKNSYIMEPIGLNGQFGWTSLEIEPMVPRTGYYDLSRLENDPKKS